MIFRETEETFERCQLDTCNTKKKNSEQMPGAVDEDKFAYINLVLSML